MQIIQLQIQTPSIVTVSRDNIAWSSNLNFSYFCSGHTISNNSMKHSLPLEANSRSATQEIACLAWKPKVHYRVRKNTLLALSWARWIQSTPSHPV
jgi:hypothetical protein